MTATIHTLHGEIQSPNRQRSYWTLIHETAMTNLRAKYLKQASTMFGQIVIDESMKSGNSYLAGEASKFLEFLQSLEGAGK